jgi:hypothetical protein
MFRRGVAVDLDLGGLGRANGLDQAGIADAHGGAVHAQLEYAAVVSEHGAIVLEAATGGISPDVHIPGSGGLGLPIIGKLLGHTQASTTQRYAHLDADPLRRASEAIAGRIAAALDGKPGGPVVQLKGVRRRH